MEEVQLQQITLKFDQKTIDYLTEDVKRKRAQGVSSHFSDIFLIRLTEGLNKKQSSQVFKVKAN